MKTRYLQLKSPFPRLLSFESLEKRDLFASVAVLEFDLHVDFVDVGRSYPWNTGDWIDAVLIYDGSQSDTNASVLLYMNEVVQFYSGKFTIQNNSQSFSTPNNWEFEPTSHKTPVFSITFFNPIFPGFPTSGFEFGFGIFSYAVNDFRGLIGYSGKVKPSENLIAQNVTFDPNQGYSFTYLVNGKFSSNPNASVYWARDKTFASVIGDPIFSVPMVHQAEVSPVTIEIPFEVTINRPDEAKYLMFVLDPVSETPANALNLFGKRGKEVEFLEHDNILTLSVVDHFAWLVHGFNPNPLSNSWESFRQDYSKGGAYYNATQSALEKDGDLATVSTLAWDSSSGWLEAFLFTALKSALPFLGGKSAFLIPLFNSIIEDGLLTGRLLSLKASSDLESEMRNTISNSVWALDGNGRPTKVMNPFIPSLTLFGHSRGGEVVARALRNVRSTIGDDDISTQSFLLDAFGTDWPGAAAVLGTDWPFPIGQANDYNVLVSDGFIHGDGFFDQLLRNSINLFSGLVLPDNVLPNDFAPLGAGEWKAPPRPPMKSLLFGQSKHTTITDLFFRWDFSVYLSALNTDPTGNGEGLVSTEVPQLSRVRGGDARRLIEEINQFSIRSTKLPPEMPEWLRAVVLAFENPQAWLHTNWQTTGDVRLDPINGKFEFSGSSASMSQVLAIPPGSTELIITELVSETQTIEGAGRLEIYFDGKLIKAISYTEIAGSNRHSVTLTNLLSESRVGVFELRYSNSESTSRLSFQEIALNSILPQIKASVKSDGLVAQIAINSDAVDLAIHEFYIESNGISGLQIGDGGDRRIDFIMQNDNTIVANVDTQSLPNYLMISYLQQDGRRVFTEIPVEENLNTNFFQPLDTNVDGFVTPIDALLVINFLNLHGTTTANGVLPQFPINVNSDSDITPLDALLVINFLNLRGQLSGEGEFGDSLAQEFFAFELFEIELDKKRKQSTRPR